MLEWIQRARRLSRGSLFAVLALCLAPSLAQAQEVQGCQPNQYLDRTAPGADRELIWDFSVSTDPERCLQVVAGQTVVFQSENFGFHPLAGSGGDTPNPISQHVNGSVTFPAAGTFGFKCQAHSPMDGAIRVVAPPTPVPALNRIGLAVMLLAVGSLWIRKRLLQRSH